MHNFYILLTNLIIVQNTRHCGPKHILAHMHFQTVQACNRPSVACESEAAGVIPLCLSTADKATRI
jgi:hypothetical protein